MTDDWIPCRADLIDDPAVDYIAGALSIKPQEVVGSLIAVWAWAGKFTANGRLMGTLQKIDTLSGRESFGAAMVGAGWLHHKDGVLILPKWDRWNSKSAKRRVLDSRRKSAERRQSVQDLSASQADKMRTREEKSTGEEQSEKKEPKPKTPPAALVIESDFPILKDPLFAPVWAEWIEARKQIKQPLKSMAAKQQLNDCQRWGVARAIQSIRTSIGSQWTGLFEPKASPSASAPRANPVPVPIKSGLD